LHVWIFQKALFSFISDEANTSQMNILRNSSIIFLLLCNYQHIDAFSLSPELSSFHNGRTSNVAQRLRYSISNHNRAHSTRLYYLSNPQGLPDTSDPYLILNLNPETADISQIKKAYRQMALIYHPDTRAYSSEEERRMINSDFARINAAYAYLTGKSDDLPEPTPQELYIQQQQQQIQQQMQRNQQGRSYNWNSAGVHSQPNYSNHQHRKVGYRPQPQPEGGRHVLEFDMNGNPIKRQSYRNSYESVMNGYHDPYSNRKDDPTCPSSSHAKGPSAHCRQEYYDPHGADYPSQSGFHGASSPVQEDMDRSQSPFLEGDLVKITQGSYTGFAGRVVSVYRTVVSQSEHGKAVAAPTMIKVEISPNVNIFVETSHAQRDGEVGPAGPFGEAFDSSENASFTKGSIVKIIKGSWKGRVGKIMSAYPEMLKVELSPTMSIFVQIDYVERDTMESYEAAINNSNITDLPAGGETDEEIFGYSAESDSSFNTMFVETTKKGTSKKDSSTSSGVSEVSPEDETLGEYFGYQTSGNEAAFTKGEPVKIIKGPYAGRRGKVMTAYPDMLKIELSYTMSVFVEMKYVTKKIDEDSELSEKESELQKT
jgi:ribosomal protein L24